jgi:hypothetical protein
MIQPPIFELEGQENKVFKLAKALYGLKQAPRAWLQRWMNTFAKWVSKEVNLMILCMFVHFG